MPKYYDDFATIWASHGRNDLPNLKFNYAGIEADNSSSISMPEGLHIPRKVPPSTAMTRQHLAEGHVPSSGSYEL
jgi:hypothetical protein